DGAPELTSFLDDRRLNAVVLGPGLGVSHATRDLVIAALAGERAVVLDADAPADLFGAIRQRAPAATVLTPHGGEFVRLFGGLSGNSHLPEKLQLARKACEAVRAIVVLK